MGKPWAKIKVGFPEEVLAQLAKDRAEGEWTGPGPDPTLDQVLRVLNALGRLGFAIQKPDLAVEPMTTQDFPMPTATTRTPPVRVPS